MIADTADTGNARLIPGFVSIFRTDAHPASAQGQWDDPHGKMQNLVGQEGVVCRIVDFPPVPADVCSCFLQALPLLSRPRMLPSFQDGTFERLGYWRVQGTRAMLIIVLVPSQTV